jgi:hypothetical protein
MSMNDVGMHRRELIGKIGIGAGIAALGSGSAVCANQETSQDTLSRGDFNILDFGAVPDGRTLNTQAIQKAIDVCADAGGGRLVMPPGIYLSGTIVLKNNINLHICKNATLLGSPSIDDYPVHKQNFPSYTDLHIRRSLIFADSQEHIALTGEGTIDGNGEAEGFQTNKGNDHRRPTMIRFVKCKYVKVQDLFLTQSAHWAQHYLACENMQISGLRIFNHANYNNDGMDIDGCDKVAVSDCIIDSDDDGICMKGCSDYSCKNITINNCVIASHCNPIKCGTETTSGFENINITNCVVKTSAVDHLVNGLREGRSAIALMIVDGGTMRNVNVSNIVASGIHTPIYIRLGNRARKHHENAPEPQIGSVSNIAIQNLTAVDSGKIACNISGLPNAYVENVRLENISISSKGGGTLEDIDREVPLKEKKYPNHNALGTLPGYGFYVRYVRDITFRNVKLELTGSDERPAMVFDTVEKAIINMLNAESRSNSQPLLHLINVRDAFIANTPFVKGVNTFLNVSGKHSRRVILKDNNFLDVKEPFHFDKEVDPKDVISSGNLTA